jgi:hypothetical protein
MMKFTLASRHPDGGTRERYFYEWSIIHVALMITGPHAPQAFRRYVQHFAVSGVSGEELLYPFSQEDWESFAEHWVEKYEDIAHSLHAPDYVQRMQPHRFGSQKFITGLSNFEVVYEKRGFRSGGIKLIHFLKSRPEVSQEEFNAWFCQQRGRRILDSVCNAGLVEKYVRNVPVSLDPATFRGTLFELGSIGLYAGMEELWCETVEGAIRLRRDQQICDQIRANERDFVDREGSISMIVKERVVWDFVTPGEMTPQPAILNPTSLEALIDQQGYSDFDKTEETRRTAPS